MTISEQEARALAFLAAKMRPHGARRWDEPGIYAVVIKLRDRKLADVALALTRAADDREANTPNVLLSTSSPAWRERDNDWTPPAERLDPAVLCDTCGQPRHRCQQVEHEFVEAGRARGNRLPTDQAAEIIAELRDRSRNEESKVDVIRARRSVDEAPAGLFGRGVSDEGDGNE